MAEGRETCNTRCDQRIVVRVANVVGSCRPVSSLVNPVGSADVGSWQTLNRSKWAGLHSPGEGPRAQVRRHRGLHLPGSHERPTTPVKQLCPGPGCPTEGAIARELAGAKPVVGAAQGAGIGAGEGAWGRADKSRTRSHRFSLIPGGGLSALAHAVGPRSLRRLSDSPVPSGGIGMHGRHYPRRCDAV